MAKFLLTYHGGEIADTQEGRDASMAAWTTWFGQLGSAVVDMGNPVGASKTVSASGVTDSNGSHATGYSIIEVDSIDHALKASGMCPVLADGGSVEVGELVPIM